MSRTEIGRTWFTLRDGQTLGLVVMHDPINKEEPYKAYIGLGEGTNEEADVQRILDFGAKFHPVQAALLAVNASAEHRDRLSKVFG